MQRYAYTCIIETFSMGIDLLFAGCATKVVRLLWRPILLLYDHYYGSSEHDRIIEYHNSRLRILLRFRLIYDIR